MRAAPALPAAGSSIEKLHAALHAHQGQQAGQAQAHRALLVDGCPVEDLCLSFVLPGYPGYELMPNGGEVRLLYLQLWLASMPGVCVCWGGIAGVGVGVGWFGGFFGTRVCVWVVRVCL